MELKPILERKLSVRSLINKQTDIRSNEIYIYPDSKWVGTGSNVILRERFDDFVNQLHYVKGSMDNIVNKETYDAKVQETIDQNLNTDYWEVLGITTYYNIRGDIVVLKNSQYYTTIPYKWFKLFFDRVENLTICGHPSIIFKENEEVVGVIMPYYDSAKIVEEAGIT